MSNTNGPVPLQAPEYIQRQFEKKIKSEVTKRDWVLLLGPRQHGKTSALIRINRDLAESGFRSGIVDLQCLPPNLEFTELLEWFGRSVARAMGKTIPPGVVSAELVDWLNLAIPMPGPPVIILIDEASSIRNEAHRNSFYGQIRAMKGAAAVAEADSLVANIQFVFAGTFRPETLVDDLNSPFNVCVRIDTEDLTLPQVLALTSIVLGQPKEEVSAIADLIFSSVGGQPHLVQSLLSAAEYELPEHRMNAIEVEIVRLQSEGSEHIRSLFRTVVQDAVALTIASTVASTGRVVNDPANIDYKFMTTIGLLRRDGAYLVFRNRLYEDIARSSTQLRPEDATQNVHTFLSPLDVAQFSFLADVELREICSSAYNGAVSASNNRNFRLAIIGYGVALEAILMDWIQQKESATILAAIASVGGNQKPSFNQYEDSNKPLTWRLLNLMKVGRLLGGVRGPLELPESLREFRNWVHPAVIKTHYIPEEDIAPEAQACNALLSIIMRDIA